MPQHPLESGRRAVLSGLAASGAALAFPALTPAACAQPAATGPVLRSSAFRSFGEAVARWSRAGGTLIVDADHVERAPVTMLCIPGLSYRLTSDAPRVIAYAGPHYRWLFCIYSEGPNPFVIDGALTFDGRNNCSLPFFARFENVAGAGRRDFSVDGLAARNARMTPGVSRVDGSQANAYGATAMLFAGGFDHLLLRNVRASDVTRQAGAGRAGSQGCVGIGVTGNLAGTQSARHVTIEDFEVSHIDSDDRPGSPERSDMDGVLVFQTAEAGGTRPIIQRGTIREAAGRAVKVYAPGGGGVTATSPYTAPFTAIPASRTISPTSMATARSRTSPSIIPATPMRSSPSRSACRRAMPATAAFPSARASFAALGSTTRPGAANMPSSRCSTTFRTPARAPISSPTSRTTAAPSTSSCPAVSAASARR